MNNNENMDSDHRRYFLGDDHPYKNLQHPHYEKVFGKDCKGWMIEWISWLLEISYEDTPLINKQVNPFDKGYDSLRPAKEGADEGIMFLAAPVYGSSANSYSNSLEIIPLGKWHLFFSPYMIYNSKLEYPSLDENELYNLAKRQVDSVYRLEVLVDGLGLECCRVPILPSDNAIVPIHEKNVLGISHEEVKNANESIKIIGDGYGCFLNPLDPGLHILSFKAYSTTYSLDTQIQINVRGPKAKSLNNTI